MGKVRRHTIEISSGTGEEEELLIKLVYPPTTPIANDTANLLDALIDLLQKQRFDSLANQMIAYREKCGYQLPIFPTRKKRTSDRNENQLRLEFRDRT